MFGLTGDWNHRRRALAILRRDPRKLRSLLRLRFGQISADINQPLPTPRVVSLRLSEECNLRCRMCHYWGLQGLHSKSRHPLPGRQLTTADVLKLLDGLAEFRPYLYLTGGEPLLIPDLSVILRHAAKLGIPTGVSTNGTLLSEHCDDLLHSRLDYLYVSLDEPLQGKGHVRPQADGQDSRELTIAGIQRILKRRDQFNRGLPMVQIQTVLVKENARQLREMAAWLAGGIKPDVWGIQPAVFTTEDLYQQSSIQWLERVGVLPNHWQGFIADHGDLDMERLDQDLLWLQRQKFPFRLRLYPPIGWPGFSSQRWFQQPEFPPADIQTRCLNPWLFAQIQPDGSVACCGSQPDAILGNIRQTDFMTIWHGEEAQRWRTTVTTQLFSTCSRCFSRFEYHHYSRDKVQ